MYAALWRLLPGPVPVKVLLAVLLALGVLALLFAFAFPALEPLLPFDRITLE
ncbi:hypothetical protein IEZ26_19130 [Nocardioides cavernae]|uniref:ABC transporter permease n=1 Tax=Nocardioides cavernae TaxID=1921566 RepID=A0ABR8NF48_9ACTN|nr:hypothetical protein [Nocardioides cavernae]MBD3926741.1 hypothetical protein [Nocardioides cavernae]MBM7512463.1 hypothetical protein [Nocardioides cavernae]